MQCTEAMASVHVVAEPVTLPLRSTSNAKSYSRTKLALRLLSSGISFVFLIVLVATGVSKTLADAVFSAAGNPYTAVLIYGGVLGIMHACLVTPLGFASSFLLEHRYGLSTQTLARWVWERVKGMAVGLPLAAGLLVILFYCLRAYDVHWWLPVALVVTILSVVLARIAPVLIMPLFYTFTPLAQESLRVRLERLCASAGVRVEGVYAFNMSKQTRKANAGFTGIGKGKRIIIGDTLVREFTEEEIETVFAHELGHYYHHHILIGLATGILSTFAGLWCASVLLAWSAHFLGLTSVADPAVLPLLAVWLALFGMVTGPIGNIISRRHERQADAFAVERTGNAPAFIAALRKLARQNLADEEPHPLVEFLFFSHPSIASRIRAAEAMRR